MSRFKRQNSIPGPLMQADGRVNYGAGVGIPTPPDAPAGIYPARVPIPEYAPGALARLESMGARFQPIVLGWRKNRNGDWALGKPPPEGVGLNGHAGFDLLTATGHIAGLHGGALALIPASLDLAVVDVDVVDQDSLDALIAETRPYLITPTARIGGVDLWWHCPPDIGAGVEDCYWRIGALAGDIRYAKGYVALWPGVAEKLAWGADTAGVYPHYPAARFGAAKVLHPASGAGSRGPHNAKEWRQWDNPNDAQKGGEHSGITRYKDAKERKALALSMQAQGYDIDAIALELGITRRSAYRYLRPDYLPDVRPDYQRHLPLIA